MGVVGGMADAAADIMAFMGLLLKRPISSFCELETSENRHMMVARDGSLVSVIQVFGSMNVVGVREMENIVEAVSGTLVPFMQHPGHAVQVWFGSDPTRGGQQVKAMLQPIWRQSQAAGLNISDMLTEKEELLPKHVSWEGFYLVLWSRPGMLSKTELQEVKARQAQESAGAPMIADGQWPLRGIEALASRHTAFVGALCTSLRSVLVHAQVIDVHDVLREARSAVYPELAGNEWQPYLPGDKVMPRMPDDPNSKDAGEVLWPPLRKQLFPIDSPKRHSAYSVQIGETVFGAVDMELGPSDVQPFMVLFNAMRESGERIPWRCSFLLEGGGLAAMAVKSFTSSVLTWANSDNRRIKNALDQLREADMNGQSIIRFRASFATWVPVSQSDRLSFHLAQLRRAVERWGGCQATMLAGDPLEGVMSSALALHCASTATSGAPPIQDAVYMLPWGRAASPWPYGTVLFCTEDGRLWPYMPGSSLQNHTVEIIVAPPGSGKSVLLNSTALGVCLAPQKARRGKLPRIVTIDIGPSSKGRILVLKNSLPPERQHEAAYFRLRNIPEHSINVFDTQLGCRFPLPFERDFLRNFLVLLCTQAGTNLCYDGIPELVSMVVDEVYRLRADDQQPNRYSVGVDALVDKALANHSISLPVKPTWWDVVDQFTDRGLYHEASLAQRHAVPILADVIEASRSRQIEDMLGGKKAPTGESIIQAFHIYISAALKDYAILSQPTRFDIAGARVISLDLADVAPKGAGKAQHQTAIMYMLAQNATTRDFYLTSEYLDSFPQRVRGYHTARIRELSETVKRLEMDEYHRPGSVPAINSQTIVIIREGRKAGVQISLASQLLVDFHEDILGQATSVFVLGANSDADVEAVVKKFNLSDTGRYVLRRKLTGPGPGGAPFLAILTLKGLGRYEQLLYNLLGPVELWAFSTTPNDAALRQRIYEKLGYSNGLQALALSFPEGSADKEIERRINQRNDRALGGGKDEDNVMDEMVSEILSQYSEFRVRRRIAGR